MDTSRDLINLDENAGASGIHNDLNNNTMLKSHSNEIQPNGECPYPRIPNVLPVGDVNEDAGQQQGAAGFAPPVPPPAYYFDSDVSKHVADNNYNKANDVDSGYVNVNRDQNPYLSTENNVRYPLYVKAYLCC